MNRRGFLFESVLTPKSANEIKSLSPYAIDLARRWVKEWPEKARQLEAAGKLISALKIHAEKEALQQWRSRIRKLSQGAPGSDMPPRQDQDFSQPAP
jgi:hypothetical protein